MKDQHAIESLRGQLDLLRRCCLGTLPFDPADIVEVIHDVEGCECWPKSCGSYCEGFRFSVSRLRDSRIAVHHDYEDTSGHGCQCGASAEVHPDLETALRLGLGQDERDKLARIAEEGGPMVSR